MKALSRAIERFCYKHPKFGIPRLMIYIVGLSAVAFLISVMEETEMLRPFIEFNPALILRGQVWRIVTWLFIPLGGNPFFTIIALYFYYFIGSTLENEWGTPKFTIYYLSGVLLNIVYGTVMYYVFRINPGLSANFINLSMFFAFAVLFPEHRILLFFFIPVKIKWLAWVNAALFAWVVVSGIAIGIYTSDYTLLAFALLPLVALLNFFVICGDYLFAIIRQIMARTNNPQRINFKKAAKQARREHDGKDYHHKCAVCGKTDADHPDLEFRYCSHCEGYHCFCLEHIGNHIHFK